MCGGSAPAATITVPDYGAYNQQFELQKAAIDQTMSSSVQLMQNQLNNSLLQQQQALEAANEAKRVAAENTSAQAMRMAQLIGTPPPEKSATAPVVGRNRASATAKGKGALRIESAKSAGFGPGAGLNIT
jgi:hypothetical protein